MKPNSFTSRLKHAWNAFMNRDPTDDFKYDIGPTYSYRPDRPRLTPGNEQSIINAIFNRIAIDAASIDIRHVDLDVAGRYITTRDSNLNRCLSLEANTDQTGRAFIQDVVMSMLDEGSVAIVPTDTTIDPRKTDSYDILSLRVGKILEWMPQHVRVRVYNERSGKQEDITVPKRTTAIIENPLYAVINERNSTLSRLIRKLNLLDVVDEQSGSGKLDLIIQLPYVVKSKARQDQAERRRQMIEEQLADSKYGIAYTDGTERITQLNRSVENNLLNTVDYLQKLLYSQLGITDEIMNGTANEDVMLNYYTRTIEPILSAITDEMKRKFLTKTGITQGQSIEFFRDPFSLVPAAKLAEIADKFTRNEILTSNEIRQIIGIKPATDPNADKLRNSNNVRFDTESPDGSEDSSGDVLGMSVDDLVNSTSDEAG